LEVLMRLAAILAAVLAGGIARTTGAQTIEVTGGAAWPRMQGLHTSAALGPSIRKWTIGLRTEWPVVDRLGVVADVRLVPRGGSIQYRQSYGYYGNYLELSPRVSWHFRDRLLGIGGSVGPTVAFRLRQQNTSSIYAFDWGPFDEVFGPMSKRDVGLLAAVGYTAMARRRFRVTLEGQYTHGFSVVHEPGLPGPSTPFAVQGRTRVVAVGLGVGIDRSR
jgi:hypothetical protein